MIIFIKIKSGVCNRNMYILYTYIYLHTNSFEQYNNEYLQQELLHKIKCVLITHDKFLYLVT